MFFIKPSGVSWLIAFLGNPGQQYENTRHNAGFIAADYFAEIHNIKINKSQFKSLTGTCTIGNEKVMALKPQTYMNLSGDAVSQAASFYKIPPERIIVISDEMSLPIGKIRTRASGSAGGHNGLKSVISSLGSDNFPRIRIGVGHPGNPDYDIKDWVLSKFVGEDLKTIQNSCKRSAEAAECYILNGCSETMNKYN